AAAAHQDAGAAEGPIIQPGAFGGNLMITAGPGYPAPPPAQGYAPASHHAPSQFGNAGFQHY
ncbi:hypothetical protein IWQ60_010346, partial [Tieghemiomyces parasiticus]